MKIYLISGDSYLLVNEKINEIIQDSKNISTLDLNSNTLTDIILEAGYISMFDEEKYIIVKNANFFGSGKLKEEEQEIILNYFENPNPNTTIIFTCYEKLDLRKKVTKILKEKYSLVTIPPLKGYEIENKLKLYIKKLGYEIDNDTIKYIVINSLANYDIVMSELSKILLYYEKPCSIKMTDVEKIVSKSINSNNFLFVDTLVEGNLAKSLELLDDLKTLKVESNVLLSLIARDFRIMLNLKKMQEKNIREYEMMNELNLMDWQLEKYLKKIFLFKVKELESILLKLAKLDLDIKSGKIDKYLGLELLILDLCE